MFNLSQELVNKFWSKVDIKGDDDCWICSQIAFEKLGKQKTATSIAFYLKYGHWPSKEKNEFIRICRNKQCVNPNHINKFGKDYVDAMLNYPPNYEYVDGLLDTQCKIWKGNKSQDGYCRIRFEGKIISIHRYVLFGIENYDCDLVTRHLCHNPSCFEKSHLVVGTDQDNTNDKTKAGRHGISDEEVIKLVNFAKNNPQADYNEIGKMFGVHPTMVGNYCRGDSRTVVTKDLCFSRRIQPITQKDYPELIKLRDEGKSYQQIAEHFNCSRGLVNKIFSKLIKENVISVKEPLLESELMKRIIEMRKSGLMLKEIAEIEKISFEKVNHTLSLARKNSLI